MIAHIPQVLSAGQVSAMRARLAVAPWIDGRATAGSQGRHVKHNRQLPEGSPLAQELGGIVLATLERNAYFISAALPNRVYPPLFNRYESGMQFGSHVDNAVRLLPGDGSKIRTDLSATLFLTEPAEYEGGELLVEGAGGVQSIKLPAGHLVLYPSNSLHRVVPVTGGTRFAAFFWIESLVRDNAQRSLLFDLDIAIQKLGTGEAGEAARLELTNCYHNLLRMWAL